MKKVNISNLQEEFDEIPKIYTFNAQEFHGYDKFTELHHSHGWRDLNVEDCNPLTQKHLPNELINNEVWKRVVDLSEEELKPVVPERISNLNLKLQLIERGFENAEIIGQIEEVPEYMFTTIEKKKAIVKYEQAVWFDRYNADLMLIAFLLGLDETDLDEIFINGNSGH